jgi:polysaccharide biosynthesis/export protein
VEILNLRLYCLVAAFLLTGCTGLPGSGPGAKSILEGGTVSTAQEDFGYQVIQVDKRIVQALNQGAPRGFVGSIDEISSQAGVDSSIGIGDTVSVSIFESSPGGLFGSSDALGNGTKNVTLPPQQVDRNGKISVPYAGQIRAAGRSPVQVQKAIQVALSKQAIEPQVIVSIIQNASRFITVSGEVGQGGRFPLSPRGDRVMDSIGLAGGPRNAAHQIYVRITRGKKTAVIRLSELVKRPDENILLAPGDQLFLYREPKQITFLGATARNSSVEMETDDLSLAEALGKASGLLDERSDPKGIFVFRIEDKKLLDEMGVETGETGKSPVVYNIDFGRAQGIFLTQTFPVRDKDVIYISNSPSTDLTKFLQLVNLGIGTAANATVLGSQLKN